MRGLKPTFSDVTKHDEIYFKKLCFIVGKSFIVEKNSFIVTGFENLLKRRADYDIISLVNKYYKEANCCEIYYIR